MKPKIKPIRIPKPIIKPIRIPRTFRFNFDIFTDEKPRRRRRR